jgi:hypothetical protein
MARTPPSNTFANDFVNKKMIRLTSLCMGSHVTVDNQTVGSVGEILNNMLVISVETRPEK